MPRNCQRGEQAGGIPGLFPASSLYNPALDPSASLPASLHADLKRRTSRVDVEETGGCSSSDPGIQEQSELKCISEKSGDSTSLYMRAQVVQQPFCRAAMQLDRKERAHSYHVVLTGGNVFTWRMNCGRQRIGFCMKMGILRLSGGEPDFQHLLRVVKRASILVQECYNGENFLRRAALQLGNDEAFIATLHDLQWYILAHLNFKSKQQIEPVGVLHELNWFLKDNVLERKAVWDGEELGAYGVVHKSKWLELECAMKTFTASKKTELKKDAAILENLKHPNILQLIFCTIQPKSCSLVLELMSTDLNKFIKGRISPDNEVPFTLPVALDVMLQIARALKYIHERGVGHRDIKPSNILMTPTQVPELVEMGYVEVKLADFGMAKEDLVFKQQNYPLKADVYSYGITCAEILSGKPPYSEVRRVNHLSTIMKGVRPPLPIEYCPAHVANLINRCWDTDPCNRPSFSQICTELVDFQRFVFLCNLAEPNDFQRSCGVVDHLQSLQVEVKTEQAQLTDPKDEYSEQNIPSAAGASAQQPSSDTKPEVPKAGKAAQENEEPVKGVAENFLKQTEGSSDPSMAGVNANESTGEHIDAVCRHGKQKGLVDDDKQQQQISPSSAGALKDEPPSDAKLEAANTGNADQETEKSGGAEPSNNLQQTESSSDQQQQQDLSKSSRNHLCQLASGSVFKSVSTGED
ncbi:unnamed protein product [Sphagnum balticum]